MGQSTPERRFLDRPRAGNIPAARPGPRLPTVHRELTTPHSLLHFVRELIQLRRTVPALRTTETRRVLSVGYPFAYLRGDSHLVVLNPRRRPAQVTLDQTLLDNVDLIIGSGIACTQRTISVDGFGHGIFELHPEEASLSTKPGTPENAFTS